MATDNRVMIKYLNPGDTFRLLGSTGRVGELIICFDCGDAKVKMFKGTKSEVTYFSQECEVIPITKTEAHSIQNTVVNVVNQPQLNLETAEKVEAVLQKRNYIPASTSDGIKKTDRFSCRINSISGMINAVMTRIPQTLEEIGNKLGVSSGRVMEHFEAWRGKKKGIALVLKEKNGKFWIEE